MCVWAREGFGYASRPVTLSCIQTTGSLMVAACSARHGVDGGGWRSGVMVWIYVTWIDAMMDKWAQKAQKAQRGERQNRRTGGLKRRARQALRLIDGIFLEARGGMNVVATRKGE